MFKSGFISINGKPNVGKSTLINSLVGEKVSIVTWKAQTTRDNIVGILNGEDYQAIFIDTPGLHTAQNKLGSYMMKSARTAMRDVDIMVYVINGDEPLANNDLQFVEMHAGKEVPLIVVVNKQDIAGPEKMFTILEELNKIDGIKEIVPVSALKNKNVDHLKDLLVQNLQEGVQYYPEDMVSDKGYKFMASEIIREKTLRLLDKEVPYGIGVSLSKFQKREGKNLYDIEATIFCEKDAHKPIIIGKGGSMLKKISTYARQDLEDLMGCKIYLRIWVKVKPDWREDVMTLEQLGYSKKNI